MNPINPSMQTPSVKPTGLNTTGSLGLAQVTAKYDGQTVDLRTDRGREFLNELRGIEGLSDVATLITKHELESSYGDGKITVYSDYSDEGEAAISFGNFQEKTYYDSIEEFISTEEDRLKWIKEALAKNGSSPEGEEALKEQENYVKELKQKQDNGVTALPFRKDVSQGPWALVITPQEIKSLTNSNYTFKLISYEVTNSYTGDEEEETQTWPHIEANPTNKDRDMVTKDPSNYVQFDGNNPANSTGSVPPTPLVHTEGNIIPPKWLPKRK